MCIACVMTFELICNIYVSVNVEETYIWTILTLVFSNNTKIIHHLFF